MKRAMLFWKRALSDILEGVVLTLFLGARPQNPSFLPLLFHFIVRTSSTLSPLAIS